MRLRRGQIEAGRRRLVPLATAAMLAAIAALPGTPSAATTVAPANTGEPSITGTPQVGDVLRTTRGTWTGTTPITYTYEWRRCNGRGLPDASNCVRIAHASRASYVVHQGDVGFQIRSRVTATNSDGSASAASNPTDVVVGAKPTNTQLPTITGSLVVGGELIASRGTWVGQQPMTFGFRWLRCNTAGGGCGEIGSATAGAYTIRDADAGHTLRVRVTARNDFGSRSATSAATSVVQSKPSDVIALPDGGRSIPVADVPKDARLVVAQVLFGPSVVTTRSQPITIRIRIMDTRGFVVRGASVFVRATPRVTTGDTLPTATDGWVTFQLQPLGTFPLKRGAVQFFVKAYRVGDPVLAGVAGYRLVQVIVRPST